MLVFFFLNKSEIRQKRDYTNGEPVVEQAA